MKKILGKVMLLIFTFAIGIILKTTNVEASSVSLSANTQTPQQGQTVTVTASVTSGAWNLKLVGAGKSETIYGYTNSNSNSSASKSISFTAGEPGTTYTISLTGDMTDINATTAETVNKSITITVAKTSTNNNTNNDNTSNSKPNANSNAKSNVATLSNLGITPNDFKGFTPSKLSYSTEVPNDVETIEIYAKKGQNGQTISGIGKKTLKEGNNTFNIVVTAEDGKTQKTYTLNVTRKAKEDNSNKNENVNENVNENEIVPDETEETTEANFGLTKLSISGLELQPQFQTDVYEYRVELKEDLDKLDIEAISIQENADIEIMGNENLQEGENIITILVKGDSEDKNVAYQIIVNKSVQNQEEQTNKNEIINIIIIAVAAGVLLIVLTVIIVKKVKNSNNKAFVPYENLFDDTEENEEIDMFETSNNPITPTQDDENSFDDFDDEETKQKHKKRSKGKRFK